MKAIEKITELGNKKPIMMGQIFAVLNAILGAFQFYSVKKVESLDGTNIVYFRGQTATLFGYAFLCMQDEIPVWPDSDVQRRVILIRMCFSGVAITMKTTAAKINPLQEFIIILRTEVIQTMIIGIIFLGKRLTIQKLVSCLLSQFGVIMITYPEQFMGDMSNAEGYDPSAHEVTILGFCIAFFAGTISASTKLFVAENADNLRAPHVTLWVGVSLIFTGVTTNLMVGHFKLPVANEIGWLFCASILGIFGQICMFLALAFSKNAIYVTLYANFQVVIIFIIDYLFEGNNISIPAIIGAVAVIAAAIIYQFGKK